MKIKYANVDDKEISSFAYIICEENEKLFSPVYNKWDKVAYFIEVDIVNTFLLEIYHNIDLRIGNIRIYAYFCEGKVYIGDKREIKNILKTLISQEKIRSPFSLLEVIQFLGITGMERRRVIEKCHRFLVENISPEGIKLWEDSVNYSKYEIDTKESLPNDPKDDYLQLLPRYIETVKDKLGQGALTPQFNMREGI